MSYDRAVERMKTAAEFHRRMAAEAAEAGSRMLDQVAVARAEVWGRALTVIEEEIASEPAAALSPERA